jgi:hypothetical protein
VEAAAGFGGDGHQGLRRGGEGMGMSAGGWGVFWWKKQGERGLGLLQFGRAPATAMAENRGEEEL